MNGLRRLEKLRRFARWRFASAGCLPVWWHVGRPNFGDDINPTLFGRFLDRGVRFAVRRDRPHIVGAGSILEHASPAAVVCGAGFLRPPSGPLPTPAALVAVRGERSLAAFPAARDVLLGDPLVLIDDFVEATAKRHRFGCVPHVLSVARWRRLNGRRMHLIDPAAAPWTVVREIAACEVVFSQSLHGLIVADALGIPNVWVAPSDDMSGGRFKFDDYFSTIDRPKECVAESADLFAHPARYEAGVGRYRHSKPEYRRRLAAAGATVAERLAAGRATSA
jgi:pyruvyltransferase